MAQWEGCSLRVHSRGIALVTADQCPLPTPLRHVHQVKSVRQMFRVGREDTHRNQEKAAASTPVES